MSTDTLDLRRPWHSAFLGSAATFVTGVVLLAGAIHIITILLVPAVAESDGWSRLAALAGTEAFAEIRAENTDEATVGGLDPLFVNGACHFKIEDAPASLIVEGHDRFWSLALYDPQGTIVFSLNDRTAVAGRLDMLVVTPTQNAALRHAPPPDIDQTIVVESASTDLIALLRLFAPSDRSREDARGILGDAECLPSPLAGGDDSGG